MICVLTKFLFLVYTCVCVCFNQTMVNSQLLSDYIKNLKDNPDHKQHILLSELGFYTVTTQCHLVLSNKPRGIFHMKGITFFYAGHNNGKQIHL